MCEYICDNCGPIEAETLGDRDTDYCPYCGAGSNEIMPLAEAYRIQEGKIDRLLSEVERLTAELEQANSCADGWTEWHTDESTGWTHVRTDVLRRHLDAKAAPVAVPDGWVLLPDALTSEQRDAIEVLQSDNDGLSFDGLWSVIIESAPKPPLNAAKAALAVEAVKCVLCGGDGHHPEPVGYVPVCCMRGDGDECCGDPDQEPEWGPCEQCGGTGQVGRFKTKQAATAVDEQEVRK